MTLRLQILDARTGQTHEHRSVVARALSEHLQPGTTQEFFARLMAAGGTHDASLCERCKAVAAAKARAESERAHARLERLAREAGLVQAPTHNSYDRMLDDHVATWHETRLRYVEGYEAEDEQDRRADLVRAMNRRYAGLKARVNACSPEKIPQLMAELHSEVKRCKALQDDMLLDRAAREQGRALRAIYSLAHSMAMERYSNIMFHREPPKPRPQRVRSTPTSLSNFASYESVCSCGYGYVH